jgi:hypothetical protein
MLEQRFELVAFRKQAQRLVTLAGLLHYVCPSVSMHPIWSIHKVKIDILEHRSFSIRCMSLVMGKSCDNFIQRKVIESKFTK